MMIRRHQTTVVNQLAKHLLHLKRDTSKSKLGTYEINLSAFKIKIQLKIKHNTL